MAMVATRTRWRRVVPVETEHQTEIGKVYEHQEHKAIPEQRRDEPTAHQSSVASMRLYLGDNGVRRGGIGAHSRLQRQELG
jgi:hypothetical protein